MLSHGLAHAAPPRRAVVLGPGFIGNAAGARMSAAGAETLLLGREAVDLLADGADTRLASLLREDDALVVTAAEAPCKSAAMLARNVRMMGAVCAAIASRKPAYVLYASSDAVYADSDAPLTEESLVAPNSLHGIMHMTREAMLRDVVGAGFGVIRPTLVYGAADPHNGYGPNRFVRQAARGVPITLFGNGEERRDHILVDDVAELVRLMVWHRSAGILNAATGEVRSFNAIAQAAARFGSVAISTTPRSGPMPHNGYRPFGVAAVTVAFPQFRFTPFETGFDEMNQLVRHG
ncbi:NAD-dependent epimerase/dehydratase family protein [Undibacter mobilis]|uniref:NAD-dependent epimerase/dehydratase family protein n=1 Tax=Undibacter mobilis TaxID=2292256 RepID=A0A371B6D3_9BRAD|nr:NAD-dependent epimerase/dehydratase family protein [Undibacter mobilis]RDV03155.1 NAD-dependent epimerase/dehydratase family protein [Undibacter mobilis]